MAISEEEFVSFPHMSSDFCESTAAYLWILLFYAI